MWSSMLHLGSSLTTIIGLSSLNLEWSSQGSVQAKQNSTHIPVRACSVVTGDKAQWRIWLWLLQRLLHIRRIDDLLTWRTRFLSYVVEHVSTHPTLVVFPYFYSLLTQIVIQLVGILFLEVPTITDKNVKIITHFTIKEPVSFADYYRLYRQQ